MFYLSIYELKKKKKKKKKKKPATYRLSLRKLRDQRLQPLRSWAYSITVIGIGSLSF